MSSDSQAFRVSLICDCQQDAAFGYGTSLSEARTNAEAAFKEHHGARAMFTQVSNECAVEHAGGSHYELHSAGIRYQFTDGLGSELAARAVSLGFGSWWAAAMAHSYANNRHPYTFETHSKPHAYMLLRLLDDVRNAPGNAKLRESAQRIYAFLARVARVVFE